MHGSDNFQTIPVKIAHIAEPKRYPVEKIEQCFSIDLSNNSKVDNPFWQEGQDEGTKKLQSDELFKWMLAAGWQTSMIGWVRGDGLVNFGQAPTVNHKLVAVMVKLKAS
jgi:hypothetical protein